MSNLSARQQVTGSQVEGVPAASSSEDESVPPLPQQRDLSSFSSVLTRPAQEPSTSVSTPPVQDPSTPPLTQQMLMPVNQTLTQVSAHNRTSFDFTKFFFLLIFMYCHHQLYNYLKSREVGDHAVHYIMHEQSTQHALREIRAEYGGAMTLDELLTMTNPNIGLHSSDFPEQRDNDQQDSHEQHNHQSSGGVDTRNVSEDETNASSPEVEVAASDVAISGLSLQMLFKKRGIDIYKAEKEIDAAALQSLQNIGSSPLQARMKILNDGWNALTEEEREVYNDRGRRSASTQVERTHLFIFPFCLIKSSNSEVVFILLTCLQS